MTTEDEKRIIADTVIEYSESSKRLVALEAEARMLSGYMQIVEVAFRGILFINDKERLMAAIEKMPSREKLEAIMAEVDQHAAGKKQCEETIKAYGLTLPLP